MARRISATLAIAALGAVGAGAVVVARRRRTDLATPVRRDGGYATARAVTVDRSMETVRELWTDPERLGMVLDRPVTAERLDEHRWRYRIAGPSDGAGQAVEVVAELRDGAANWRVERGAFAHEGRLLLTVAPGDRGTEVRVELGYRGGLLRRGAAMLRGRDPDQLVRTVLRRAKALLEAGRVVSTMAEPAARGPVGERVTRVIREKLATGGRP